MLLIVLFVRRLRSLATGVVLWTYGCKKLEGLLPLKVVWVLTQKKSIVLQKKSIVLESEFEVLNPPSNRSIYRKSKSFRCCCGYNVNRETVQYVLVPLAPFVSCKFFNIEGNLLD
ncbi:unnamed protein product [Cuscuta europaea]|uniref:Secreted protein n=1 Tax=Cuscuta europaea TaxID=41803 RepID=A0A9P1E6M0_CUSEU|nr:unnamed protein product [Cuscuta europaea]